MSNTLPAAIQFGTKYSFRVEVQPQGPRPSHAPALVISTAAEPLSCFGLSVS